MYCPEKANSQSQKVYYWMGSGNNGQTVHGNGGGASFWGDENVLEILILAQPCDYTKNTKLHTLK